jgi:flagellar hook-basal body protein
LNDQNNVVNSTGQRLMAASVDSSGKADLTDLNALTIPPKTSGEAVETTKIQLGLNLPADSVVINSDFDRSNPSTYNKSTALTVYDSGGNGYLATVYYAKTQNASQDQTPPSSKWQTYFFVGDTQVKPALQQATDKAGSSLFVNKYGDVLPKSDPRVIPSSGTTEMFSLDQLTNTQISAPANASGNAVSVSANGTELAMTGATLASGTSKLEIKFKASPTATTVETMSYTLGAGDRYPEVLAKNVQEALNAKLATLGTEKATVTVVNTNGVISYTTKFSGTSVEHEPFSTKIVDSQNAAFANGTPVTFEIAVDGANTPQTIQYTLTNQDKSPDAFARNLEIAINNKLGSLDPSNARFGVRVTFDPETAKFNFASGTTGDESTLLITNPNANASTYLGMPTAAEITANPAKKLEVFASPDDAMRGKASKPAELFGATMTINTTKSIAVGSSNKDFFVSVDGISGRIEVPPQTYNNMEKFAEALQTQINTLVERETGRKVSGVTVKFDPILKRLSFNTGTTGDNASIQVSGSADWGLSNTEMKFGQTTNWIKLQQFTENGAPQYVKNGIQTEDASGLSSKTEWWPIYLDRGELSFDLTGKPVSPLTAMPFETAFLAGGKGALTMSIDFTKSTQYSSAFAVLSQSQDGAPEGELMGLNIGVDGLVNATYSNGSQVSLGKIVLANFSSPSGLRQVGDASYLASATSGVAKIGEAGSAGFGSIRAGATERANVDLTQELVDLITAQRNFQANAKAIETSSTMTTAIINIRS